jgi:paraquat-inducible protein B
MSDEQSPLSKLPQAEIHIKRGFSIIWVVPLVALLIGGWMGYKTWSEQGPTITISFTSAEGLQKDKTKVKYKEVDIGKVVAIKLSDDLARVLVTVEMDQTAETYLTEDALFWVVRARVTADEVSGLDTLFSGAYIGMEPGKAGKTRTEFTGLEVAPVLMGTAPGQHFLLHADNLGSLDIGHPVYYRKLKVGKVVSYALDPVSDRLNIQVFIAAPYHQKVRQETRFYQASGIDINIDANGLKVSTESLVSLLLGGIAFETPSNLAATAPLGENSSFELYPNRESISQHDYTIKEQYLLNFKGSVRGLSAGAPVEFQGIKVGQVLSVELNFDGAAKDFSIPVLIELEPERIVEVNITRAADINLMDYLVERGLRGQLQNSNLLTGQLFVDMKIFADLPPEKILRTGPYPLVPTVPMPLRLEDLLASMERILGKFEKLPVAEIGADLQKVLQTLDATLQQSEVLLGNLDQKVVPEIMKSMQQFQTSISTLEESYRADSSVGRDLRKNLDELGKAARSIRVLSDYLQRHPEALLRGKGENQ